MAEHICLLPDLSEWTDHDVDYRCLCGQWWWVDSDICQACRHANGPTWAKYGSGDGTFPYVSIQRGGIKFTVVDND